MAFDVSDGLKIVRFALQSINPKLADDLPKSIDLALLKLKQREFARSSSLESPSSIRWLGIVAPMIAVLVLLGSVLLERDRRVGHPPRGARGRRGRARRSRSSTSSCATGSSRG